MRKCMVRCAIRSAVGRIAAEAEPWFARLADRPMAALRAQLHERDAPHRKFRQRAMYPWIRRVVARLALRLWLRCRFRLRLGNPRFARDEQLLLVVPGPVRFGDPAGVAQSSDLADDGIARASGL